METEPKAICGGCLCGAVRYEGIAELYNVTHCHCEDCRKSAGAPFVTWASFQRSDFQFTKGKPLEIAWAGRVRSFCSTYGSSLTFTSEPDADEIDVTVATFDQPEIVTWTDDRISWIKLGDIYRSMHEAERNELESMRIRALAIGAQSVGALALGALAIGAFALGVVAVGRLVIGRAKIRRLEIGDLVVNRLRVTDSLKIPRD